VEAKRAQALQFALPVCGANKPTAHRGQKVRPPDDDVPMGHSAQLPVALLKKVPAEQGLQALTDAAPVAPKVDWPAGQLAQTAVPKLAA
jgi:hypothetical protein